LFTLFITPTSPEIGRTPGNGGPSRRLLEIIPRCARLSAGIPPASRLPGWDRDVLHVIGAWHTVPDAAGDLRLSASANEVQSFRKRISMRQAVTIILHAGVDRTAKQGRLYPRSPPSPHHGLL